MKSAIVAGFLSFLVGCEGGSAAPDTATGGLKASGAPIVVYWTVDTLGMQAAQETGWCERINAILAAHGRDVACLDGAVPGSSWTAESHVRTLWPQHWSGALRSNETPAAGTESVLETLAAASGQSYIFASDNAIFRLVGDDGAAPWIGGTDVAYVAEDAGVLMDVPEAETEVHRGMNDLLGLTGQGLGAVAYFNDYEAGGHEPRCFFDTDSAECVALWDIALDAGLAKASDDPSEKWLEHGFQKKLSTAATEVLGDDEAELRELFWGTMVQSIEHFRGERFEVRLERLLSELESQGRIDDLVLVVAGDHGENPCVSEPFSDEVNCAHTGAPSDWTARVPVFVSPARVASEWQTAEIVGEGGTPWSLGNVAWGLLDTEGVAIPDDWAEMQPVGTAVSWDCPQGLRVVDNVSLRCDGKECAAYEWTPPDDVSFNPVKLDEIPPELQDYAGNPNWFQEFCATSH